MIDGRLVVVAEPAECGEAVRVVVAVMAAVTVDVAIVAAVVAVDVAAGLNATAYLAVT